MIAVKGSDGAEAVRLLLHKRFPPSTSLASLALSRRCITGGALGSVGVGGTMTANSGSCKSMLIALSKVASFGVFGVFGAISFTVALGEGRPETAPLGVMSILPLWGVMSPKRIIGVSGPFGDTNGSKRCNWQCLLY